MVLHVFISFLGGVPLCIPYGLYSGTSLGGTTREILGGYPGRVLSTIMTRIYFTCLNRLNTNKCRIMATKTKLSY